jgi:putative GTP pyrophosphokinase
MVESLSFRDSFFAEGPRYEAFGKKIELLMQELLAAKSLDVMSTVHRVKQLDSALSKVQRIEPQPVRVADVRDFLGVRIITYFADQVDLVSELIEAEFNVDPFLTKDKRMDIASDRFGYISVHYVVELNETRAALGEWSSYSGLRFEVQIRSVLQHAWAEIEHDLGYKATSGSIPAEFRRRFSRLAGLLEIADDEFEGLRDDLAAHEVSVAEAVNSGADISIDQVSLQAFMNSDPLMRRVDAEIASIHGSKLIDADTNYSLDRVKELESLDIRGLSDLRQRLNLIGDSVAKIAGEWLNDNLPRFDGDELDENWRHPFLMRGIGLFYFFLATRVESTPTEVPIMGGLKFRRLVERHLPMGE